MKRALMVTTLLAMGFLLAASPLRAQGSPPVTTPAVPPADNESSPAPKPPAEAEEVPEGTSGGEVSTDVLGRDSVSSSKFTEYREVPRGVAIPFFRLFSTGNRVDFNLLGYNVRQTDQRYAGWLDVADVGVAFDYNQIPHNMGNNGRTIFSETAPGVWTMSATLREALQNANDTRLPAAARTVDFYDALLAPTFASTNTVDISSLRKRGTAQLDLGKKLPFALTFTYMRELKSGYRTESGGNVRGQVNPAYEVPEPLDDLTQDFGLGASYEFKKGNVHAAFNRNLYDNRAETLIIDNPFQAFDAPFTNTVGGPSNARFINAPDNEASTGSAGFLLKFARQTRIGGDVSLGRWTQNAPFYPYTLNTVVLTPAGARADSLSTLPQPSFDGKINTTVLNLTFTSRPVKGLGVRASFRSYDLTNKTDRFVITGDTSISDRVWTVVTPSADAPFGHATASVYDHKTTRFTASASYDFGALTVEAQGRTAKLERTSREATEGTDNGFALSAVYRTSDWLAFRGTYDQAKRTAEGDTLYGFQADEAERKTKRFGAQADFTLPKSVDLSFAYFRRDVDYPNRPDRIPVTSGAPTPGGQPFPGTPSGLLLAKYDSFTVDVGYAPSERVALAAYYTYEKDRTTNQWSTSTGLNLNNLLNYAGSDETDTFGLNAAFQLKPDVWKLTLNGSRQKVDGLMDITAREAGSFYTPGRTTLIPPGTGGAQDIVDWDDTEITMLSAQLDYAVAESWSLAAGYAYEKYDFRDAYTAGDLLMPQSVYIFLKADNGPYTANVVYARASYRF